MDWLVAVWYLAEDRDIAALKKPVVPAQHTRTYERMVETWQLSIRIPPREALVDAWTQRQLQKDADAPLIEDIADGREAILRIVNGRSAGFRRALVRLALALSAGWQSLEETKAYEAFYQDVKAVVESNDSLDSAFTLRYEAFFGALSVDMSPREKQYYMMAAQMLVNEFAALAALTRALDIGPS